tara:strand:+ start:452 stop:1276 length:825 start_codon:yes stop_codon:yes gene_type:complete
MKRLMHQLRQRTVAKWLCRHRDIQDAEAAEAYVSDPSTPVDDLVRLVRHVRHGTGDPLKGVLIQNPALPIDVLLKQVDSNPIEVSRNPVFRIQMAADPMFLDSMPQSTQQALVAAPGIDARIIRYYATSRSAPKPVRCAAARNPDCPQDLMESYLRHAWEVRRELASNASLPVRLQHRLAADPQIPVRLAIASRPSVDPLVLVALGTVDEDPYVQFAVAQNPNTSESVRLRLQSADYGGRRQEIQLRNRCDIKHSYQSMLRQVLESLSDVFQNY